MLGADQDGWKPLDAGRIAAAWAKPKDKSGAAAFWKQPAQAVAAILQSLNGAPVLCSFASEKDADVFNEERLVHLHVYDVEGQQLTLWFDMDRQFDSLVCELAFGGGGIDASQDDANRPPSNAEMRLRRKLLQSIAAGFESVLSEKLEKPATLLSGEELKQRKFAPSGGRYTGCTLLLNAFGMSADMHVMFRADEYSSLFKPARDASNDAASLPLDCCALRLDAYLQPQAIDLAAMAAIKPGDVLQLQSAIGSVLTFFCGGQPLFNGRFAVVDGGYELDVAPYAASRTATPQTPVPAP
jgi:hypothetical protein